jgi:hypothetical protein
LSSVCINLTVGSSGAHWVGSSGAHWVGSSGAEARAQPHSKSV